MKKIVIGLVLLMLLATSATTWAAPPEFSGGVNNEYTYEEVVFITGEPIKFVGTYTISESVKDDEKTVKYRFNKLVPEDKSIDATFDKEITYVTKYDKRSDKGQTVGQTSVDKYREKLTITKDEGKDVYELQDYQFSKSDVIDNRPASDFYSGNLTGKKIYSINKDEGEVIVQISGGNAGYQNFWGNTETQILDYYISSERYIEGEDDEDDPEKESWTGTVKVQVSDSITKSLRYSENEASYSSFNGGHIRITNGEMVSRYDYNLPDVEDGEVQSSKRRQSGIYLSQKMVPKLERLIVPKFRDIGGHWAEESIQKLYSLDVFDEQSSFFSPEIAFTRVEFIKGLIKACNIRTVLVEEQKTRRKRNEPPEEPIFSDMKVDDANYTYVKDAVEKQITSGVTATLFKPNDPLTRAQAITMMIKALGFETKAPTPGYYTSFSDDKAIPSWAKDSIYVAREIGLIEGDNFNRVNPNAVVTRAQASAMLVRFLEFLEKDLQRDYRENIINFN
ncbi:MAG: S-layer homology domain-containing protein [Bacillota bacterium]